MPKAKVELPDGTVITIEGTQEEVRDLLEFYQSKRKPEPSRPKTGVKEPSGKTVVKKGVDHAEIVNLVKSVDEAEAIEKHILDRTSQVDRTLLPLYIVHQYLGKAFALTSGDISKVTTDLGIPIATANASRTLSGTASRYVIGDQVRKKGRPIRYKLSRRGVNYMKSVISGSGDEN